MISRDKNFDFSKIHADVWHPVCIFNDLFNSLSVMFPDGEKHFIQAIRHYEPLASEKLKEDIRVFYRQEAKHSREHRKWNERLRAAGADIDTLVEEMNARLAEFDSPEDALISTVVLEELTGFGAMMLNRFGGRILKGAHPEVAEMWRWHAIEEEEHVHVARQLLKEMGIPKSRVIKVGLKTLGHFFGQLRSNYRELEIL